jgi:hypothetical protein
MEQAQAITELEINGVKYVRKDSIEQQRPTGNRCIVVIDRGWIYAGDIEEKDGRIYLTRAVWLFGWDSIGLDGVIRDPRNSKADLRKIDQVIDLPKDAEVYRIHVDENWGL